jgi:integrase
MASIRKRSWTTAAGEERTRWQVDYLDQDGTRRHKQFPTKKAADAFLVGARYEVAQGTHTPPSAKTMVADAVQHWLDHSSAEGIDAMTLRTYAAVARHHVTPILGREKLAKLTRPAIERYRDELLSGKVPDGRKRSRVMARKALGALKAALKEAQRIGLVAQNVAAGVQVNANRSEAKGRKEVGIDVPSPAEVRAMLEAVSPRWRPLVVTAIFTGLRASELRALTWSCVDLEHRLIRVRQRADRWQQLGPPKSSAGERDVPMAPMVLNTLREWKLACPPSELDLVFPGPNGKVLDHAALYRRCFGALQLECGIVDGAGRPKYGPHAFRHFTASWLIDQGFGPKRIMGILGHADIQMTFNTYGHLFDLNDSDHERLAAGELALVGA